MSRNDAMKTALYIRVPIPVFAMSAFQQEVISIDTFVCVCVCVIQERN